MRLLLINPNTSEAVTERLRRHVGAALPSSVALEAITAPFGARYIADEASYAVAGHAALVAYAHFAASSGEPDAVLLGCFGDPGVDALRESSRRPVVGLAEAAMREAAARGRFAIVTGGAAWDPMLRRLARALGLDDALAGIEIVAPTGAQLAADPVLAKRVLGDACRRAADAESGPSPGIASIILGGAGLAGYAAALTSIAPGQAPSQAFAIPLIDSVDAGVRAILRAAAGEGPPFAPTTTSATVRADWQGLDPALTNRFSAA